MSEPMQLFPALPAAVEDALRASIRRFGVLVPVVKDQNGRTLDGHHRSRIADDLKVDYRVDTVVVADDEEAREIAHTLNSDRRQLTAEQRQEVAVALRQAGHSFRAIAGALGVDARTVQRDVSTVADATVPERVVGLDGKSRPSTRIVASKNKREAKRAVKAIEKAGDSLDFGDGVINLSDAERHVRKTVDRAAREIVPGSGSACGDRFRLINGDFSTADVADASIDLIVTDPPYPEEYAHVWEQLAIFAERVLKPGGIVAAMTGKIHLPSRMSALAKRLQYGWMYAQELPGDNTRILARHVTQEWKPWICYSKGPWPSGRIDWHGDLIVDAPKAKSHYHWQQSTDPAETLIRNLSSDGSVVCDPFLGSGSYGVAAIKAGRSFVGIELDVDRFRTASERIGAAA